MNFELLARLLVSLKEYASANQVGAVLFWYWIISVMLTARITGVNATAEREVNREKIFTSFPFVPATRMASTPVIKTGIDPQIPGESQVRMKGIDIVGLPVELKLFIVIARLPVSTPAVAIARMIKAQPYHLYLLFTT